MSKKQSPSNLISILVACIGLYMLFAFYNGSVAHPPVLSGIALVLLGVRPFVK